MTSTDARDVSPDEPRRHGRLGPSRRTATLGLLAFAGASLAGGLAPAPGSLLIARAAQGLGGALVFPATLSLVNTTFAEGRERNRAVAVWGAAGAAGLVVGVLLGGLLTQTLGWEAVFFVNVPLAGAALVLAFALVPADGEREPGRHLDLAGALSATLGVTLVVFALVEGPNLGWSSPAVLAAATASLALLAALAITERRSRDPLVSPRLLTNRNLRTAVGIAFLFWATFGSVLYFLTIYLQDVQGFDALETGVGFLLPTTVVVAGSALAGRLATRFGLRSTLVGALIVGALGAVVLGCPSPPGPGVRRGTGRRGRHRLHRHVDRRRRRPRRSCPRGELRHQRTGRPSSGDRAPLEGGCSAPVGTYGSSNSRS